jgi:hypothetical protein|tara:strand:+ start:250 stop:1341 length:1092 start_codon:yes stop_codon:yes gene_type:complete
MDSFIKIIPQKKERPPTLHEKEISLLEKYLAQGENVFICGPTGSGKTFIVDCLLNASNTIELHSELFQKKSTFLNLIGDTSYHILIDGYDSSVYGHKQVIDKISDMNEKLTKGSVIVTSTSIHMLPNFKLIIVPKRSPDAIFSLDCSNPRARPAADKCLGNIRNFYDYMNFSDEKDIFKTSKDIVIDILCRKGNGFDTSQTVHEHGHVVDVIHGNYLHSNDTNVVPIADSLSLADIYDSAMYKGEWNYMQYYVSCGMAVPKYNLGEPLKPENIQPGSTWTKYGNYKMRHNKLKIIQGRHTTKLGVEELGLIRKYAIAGDLDPLIEYKLTPLDFDIMNHLALGNKLKPSEVAKVKKKLRNVVNE